MPTNNELCQCDKPAFTLTYDEIAYLKTETAVREANGITEYCHLRGLAALPFKTTRIDDQNQDSQISMDLDLRKYRQSLIKIINSDNQSIGRRLNGSFDQILTEESCEDKLARDFIIQMINGSNEYFVEIFQKSIFLQLIDSTRYPINLIFLKHAIYLIVQ